MRSKYRFITGGASGIGRETARRFEQEGWQIGAVDISDAGLAALRDEIGSNQCATYHLDVTDAALYAGVIEQFALRSGGRRDLLFNNAGSAT